jgi:hypothetical protein
VGSDPAGNPGLSRWFGVLRKLSLPMDADAACAELMAHLEESEGRAVAALAAVTRLYEASKASCDSLRSLRDALGDWAGASTSASTALGETLSAVRTSVGTLGGKLKRTADAFANVYDLSVFAPNEIQIFLMDGLVTDIHRYVAARAPHRVVSLDGGTCRAMRSRRNAITYCCVATRHPIAAVQAAVAQVAAPGAGGGAAGVQPGVGGAGQAALPVEAVQGQGAARQGTFVDAPRPPLAARARANEPSVARPRCVLPPSTPAGWWMAPRCACWRDGRGACSRSSWSRRSPRRWA